MNERQAELAAIVSKFAGYFDASVYRVTVIDGELFIRGEIGCRIFTINTKSAFELTTTWNDVCDDYKHFRLMTHNITNDERLQHSKVVGALEELITGKKPWDGTWIYIAQFSTAVENLKRLDVSKVLSCVAHPHVCADALVVVETTKEDAMDLPFNTYTNDRSRSEKQLGGLHVWKVTDVSSFRGPNHLSNLRAEYSV